MKKSMSLLLGMVVVAAQANTLKHITVKNNSQKPIYYSVVYDWNLATTPKIAEPQPLNAFMSANIDLDIEQFPAMVDVIIIENTGTIEDINDSGNLHPICEFTAMLDTASTTPLSDADLNNLSLDHSFDSYIDVKKNQVVIK